jgi:predicted permease
VAAEIGILVCCLALGIAAQRIWSGDRVRRRAWNLFFWTLSPAVVFYAFTTIPVDRELGLALAAAILASWLTIGLGYGYARLVSRERDERGALALAAGFPNTGFLGYPMAQLAFGHPALALMVVYDRLAWLVPSSAISTSIARLHGRDGVRDAASRLRAVVLNPPLLAALAAVSLRGAGVDASGAASELGAIGGEAIGPAGFLLLGFALPLEPLAHARDELGRAAGALAIRFLGGPLLLLACGALVGASIPPVFYLAAAMPCAFHLMVLARVFDVRPRLMRLLVVASTVPAVAVIAAASALV